MGELACPLQEMAQGMPEAPAILAPHRSYTYRDYHEYVSGAVANLRKAGLSEGDLLAIALPPGTPYPILLMALFRMGAIACPMNTRFPAQYLLETLERIRCRNMVVPYGASVTTVYGRLYALAPRDLVDDRLVSAVGDATVDLERPSAIVLTSGSAGPPKAALLSYGNFYRNAMWSNENIPLGVGDRWLMSLPLYHVAGLGVLFRCLLGGASVVFPASNENIEKAIRKYEITHVSLVATQLYRLLQTPEGRSALKPLKCILLGGGPLPESLIRKAHMEGLNIFCSYGLTEMATQATTTRPGDPINKLLTVGKPLRPGTVRLSPEGEIQVCGDSLFLGYVEGNEISRTLTEDGWFATRDLGAWEFNGYLKVIGRKDNMFIAGGENIQPEEIESCLCRQEGVLQAVVVPVEHEEFGATPVAFVRLEEGRKLMPEDLQHALAPHLPKYKIPRYFLPLPENDPFTDVKVSRKELITHAYHLLREPK
ncbi:MAG TPA: o-succinylbenzoate--CoA ligase [Candidatus Hydrogenedentes bacterium]|nr:o-succinylbenzoate--CoA ligase [Candidatus Hydrogenedentota bacterium]